jgi:hypothetical protein
MICSEGGCSKCKKVQICVLAKIRLI